MSCSKIEQHDLIRQAKLLEYANTKRNTEDFNDVTIQAGAESISANRMVLACYSRFFESMFLSQLKEKYQNTVEIKAYEGKFVKSVIEYIYTGNIDINANNVMTLLSTADFLQVDHVKEICFKFLETSLTVDRCLDVVKASTLYGNAISLQQTSQFISDNFDEVVQQIKFKDLSKHDLMLLLTSIDRNIVQETSIYTAIVTWINYDENRDGEFSSLFLTLDLHNLSTEFVAGTIATEPLVNNSKKCLRAVVSYFAETAIKKHDHFSKILCVGGNKNNSVFEVFNIHDKLESKYKYPNLPVNLVLHCVLKYNNFIYCLGGIQEKGDYVSVTNKAYRLILKKANSKWEEIASMNKQRFDLGAAIWNDKLVVSGGYRHDTSSSSTELYEPCSNKWKTIASMNEARDKHELIVADCKLFAVGGRNNANADLSSVERLDNVDGKWQHIKPMNEKRSMFAVATYNKYIYAIGGCSLKTVERYDIAGDKWSFVSSMNKTREGHIAFVTNEKIFVAGGRDKNHKHCKTIDCYDPVTDKWTIIGETEGNVSSDAIAAV